MPSLRFSGLVVPVLALFVAGAGCFGGQSTGEPPSERTPTQHRPVAGGNLTGCAGHMVPVPIGESNAAALLPRPFVPRTTVPQLVLVTVQVLDCGKISVGGIDQGPGQIFILSVPIENPESGGAPQGYGPMFLLEASSNVPALETLLSMNWFVRENAVARTSTSSLPDLYDALEGALHENGSTIYSWAGYSGQGSNQYDERLRFYGAAGPLGTTLDYETRWKGSVNDLGGTFSANPGAALGPALPPGGTTPALTVRIFEENVTLRINYGEAPATN